MLLGQTAAAWPCPQTLLAHETFDPMQAAGYAFQEVMPDPASAVSAIAADVAGPDPGTDLLIIPRALRRCTGQPGMEAASRDTERLAHPRRRPDPSVLRDEGEPRIESLAK